MRTLSLLFILLTAVSAYCDLPGNSPRPSAEITIENPEKWPEYTFLYALDYYEGVTEGDTLMPGESMFLPGGFGAPPMGAIWAVHSKGEATQPIYFSNEEANMAVYIDTIIGDSIVYSATASSVPSPEIDNSGTESSKTSRRPFIMMTVIALAALSLIIVLVIKKRKANK